MTVLTALTPRRLRILLVAVPMALGLLYFSVLAANRYVSTSIVGLRQSTGDSSSMGGLGTLLTGIAPPGHDDTLYLRDYIGSLGLLKVLDARLKLRAHYEAQLRDPIYRLWGWFSQERFLDYYRSRVSVAIDDVSSALTITVEGFDPDFAQRLNKAILEESESFVNEYSHRIARENLGFAETELARAGERLQKAKGQLLLFQNKNQLLDPVVQAQAAGALTTELQSQITKAETDLRSLRSYLNDDASQVTTLRTQLQSLRDQLDLERKRATGESKNSDRINALAVEYQGLQLQTEIALDAYKIALTAVESARIESTRKLRSLVVIEAPTMPEEAEYPRRVYGLLTMLVACGLLLAVVQLVLATIREHQD